ncbi:MAG: hypothetical protein ACHREM_24375, partial [Polyangiales bacterium]
MTVHARAQAEADPVGLSRAIGVPAWRGDRDRMSPNGVGERVRLMTFGSSGEANELGRRPPRVDRDDADDLG